MCVVFSNMVCICVCMYMSVHSWVYVPMYVCLSVYVHECVYVLFCFSGYINYIICYALYKHGGNKCTIMSASPEALG